MADAEKRKESIVNWGALRAVFYIAVGAWMIGLGTHSAMAALGSFFLSFGVLALRVPAQAGSK